MAKKISVSELYTLLKTDDPRRIIVDVRMPFEVLSGKIKGAVNIPMNEVVDEKNRLAQYDMVYTVCQSGGRSLLAATELEIAGLTNVCNVDGGMREWRARGYPIEI